MNTSAIKVMCTGALALILACGGGGGGAQPQVQSFPLTTCDSDAECDTGFFCSPVYCAAQCVPDGKGGCLPCNEGKVGQCLPKPQDTCDKVTCPPADQCVFMCNGACDYGTKECKDVSCVTACIPAPHECTTDADCGPGKHCEHMCAKGCAEPVFSSAGKAFTEKCPGMECEGVCVDDPTPPKKCAQDADCPEGFVCELVACPMVCIPDGKGGCLPCNDGYPGVCVPKPQWGCMSDSDCQPNETCQITCTGFCDAFATKEGSTPCWELKCFGQCLPKLGCDAIKCPEGYECEEVCALCPEPVFWAGGTGRSASCGECTAQCVPEPKPGPCNGDADCPDGYHCEPVFCTMQCIPDGKGGCLPCNDGFLGRCVPDPLEGCRDDSDCAPGERCRVFCTGFCDPMNGCSWGCHGECIAENGCTSDEDCGEGFHCEWLCTAGCAWTPQASHRPGESSVPPCDPGQGQCFGQCVPNQEQLCDKDEDCPPGFVCEPVFCAQADYCLPDGSGGCFLPPCNEGHLGVCVPAPNEGCKSDKDCEPGERCEIRCTGLCDPVYGCSNFCFGECVPNDCGDGCPEGFECVTICPDCVPGAECGPCIEQCVPVTPKAGKCNEDADCPMGYHCEPVFCTMQCIPDGKGGCLSCNDGYLGVCEPNPAKGCKSDADCDKDERCELFCTGFCPPGAYCTEVCQGVCVKANTGCQSDADCPEGFYCEMFCTKDCGPVPSGFEPPKCIESECVGQCLPKPTQCTSDKDCPPGYACVNQEHCPPCTYADPPCLAPCWSELTCVPFPAEGCRSDSDCKPMEKCDFVCPVTCTAQDCSQYCVGQCVGGQD